MLTARLLRLDLAPLRASSELLLRCYPLSDGAGLFCSVLKHLSARGAGCPKVLAATHFHDVFTKDLLDPASAPITFLHMQILMTSSSGHLVAQGPTADADSGVEEEAAEDERRVAPGEQITYLYR